MAGDQASGPHGGSCKAIPRRLRQLAVHLPLCFALYVDPACIILLRLQCCAFAHELEGYVQLWRESEFEVMRCRNSVNAAPVLSATVWHQQNLLKVLGQGNSKDELKCCDVKEAERIRVYTYYLRPILRTSARE